MMPLFETLLLLQSAITQCKEVPENLSVFLVTLAALIRLCLCLCILFPLCPLPIRAVSAHLVLAVWQDPELADKLWEWQTSP